MVVWRVIDCGEGWMHIGNYNSKSLDNFWDEGNLGNPSFQETHNSITITIKFFIMTSSFLYLIIYSECIFLYKFLIPIECQVCQTAFLFWDNEQLWYSSFWGVDHRNITEERENHSEEAAKQKMYAVGCYQQSCETQYPNMSMSSSHSVLENEPGPFFHTALLFKRERSEEPSLSCQVAVGSLPAWTLPQLCVVSNDTYCNHITEYWGGGERLIIRPKIV